MTVKAIHLQRRLVVGSPEAEVDEPGVEQARVVRVLDVLHHQLPVARDALAVVAQQLQRPVPEDPVEDADADPAVVPPPPADPGHG